MIPFDFSYYKPGSVEEAANLYHELDDSGKHPLYYSGGTEIITMARANNIYTEAVIDLKGIPEYNILSASGEKLIIGAGVTLNRISESNLFPLLGMASGRIADHTTQGKITIGGNLAGTIIYHEALLPFLLTDSEVIIAGPDGQRQVPVITVFNERLQLKKGEFLLQIITSNNETEYPFIHVKRTKSDKIDYPVLSVAAIKKEGRIRIAFSGVCLYPFRSQAVEDALNNERDSERDKIDAVIRSFPAPMLHDISASAKYREFILRNTLENILEHSWEENNDKV